MVFEPWRGPAASAPCRYWRSVTQRRRALAPKVSVLSRAPEATLEISPAWREQYCALKTGHCSTWLEMSLPAILSAY